LRSGGWPHGWRPGDLAFTEDKTRIVRLDDGADFLGFNVRRYRGKLLIKPGKAAEPGQHDGGGLQRTAEQQPGASACDCALGRLVVP
jgi:hypothetical protein